MRCGCDSSSLKVGMSSKLHSAKDPPPPTSLSTQSRETSSAPGCLSLSSTQRPLPSRRKSLRLSNQPINIPIPPSLLESPYLNSPESIFQRAVTSLRHPSKEDEQWLQDTIPLSTDTTEGVQRPKSMELPRVEALRDEHPRSRSSEQRSMSHHPTPSPPLPWRHPITPTTPVWLGHSAPTTKQGYFTAAA